MEHSLGCYLSKVQGLAVLHLGRTDDQPEEHRSLFCCINHPVRCCPFQAALSSEEFPGEPVPRQSFAVLDVADICLRQRACPGIASLDNCRLLVVHTGYPQLRSSCSANHSFKLVISSSSSGLRRVRLPLAVRFVMSRMVFNRSSVMPLCLPKILVTRFLVCS